MAKYIDERNVTVIARNYQEAAEKLYGQRKLFDGFSPATYTYRHSDHAEVHVYAEGAKAGSYWGVMADKPERHTLKRVRAEKKMCNA